MSVGLPRLWRHEQNDVTRRWIPLGRGLRAVLIRLSIAAFSA